MPSETIKPEEMPDLIKTLHRNANQMQGWLDEKDARIAELEAHIKEGQRVYAKAIDSANAERDEFGDKVMRLTERDMEAATRDEDADLTIAALEAIVEKLPELIRQAWSFDGRQQPTHTWHDRENFIETLAAQAATPDPQRKA